MWLCLLHGVRQVDARTGMIMNLVDLKLAMRALLDGELDHKNLDLDVDFFKRQPR